MAFFGDFTIAEANEIGRVFKVRCASDFGYYGKLTIGKEYVVTVMPSILPLSPLCGFIADNGSECAAHLTRFQKLEQASQEEGSANGST